MCSNPQFSFGGNEFHKTSSLVDLDLGSKRTCLFQFVTTVAAYYMLVQDLTEVDCDTSVFSTRENVTLAP